MIYESHFYHYGIPNMKWGERNGPPYPLPYSQKSSDEKNSKKRKEPQKNSLRKLNPNASQEKIKKLKKKELVKLDPRNNFSPKKDGLIKLDPNESSKPQNNRLRKLSKPQKKDLIKLGGFAGSSAASAAAWQISNKVTTPLADIAISKLAPDATKGEHDAMSTGLAAIGNLTVSLVASNWGTKVGETFVNGCMKRTDDKTPLSDLRKLSQ